MSTPRKLSELPPFTGQQLLLDAQQRGYEVLEAAGSDRTDFCTVTLIGLANLLVERGVVKESK